MWWTKLAVKILIEKIQNFEYLYNAQSSHYMEREKKFAAYESLTKDLSSFVKDVTPNDIKKKFHNIRCQYMRELRAFENWKKSKCNEVDIYKPKLWCFNLLDFLRPYSRLRGVSLNVNEVNNDCSDDGSSSSKECIPQKKIKCDDPEDNLSKRLDAVKELITKRVDLPKHEYKWLGDQVVFEMNNIRSTAIRRKTARAIQNILNKALDEDMTSIEPSTSRYYDYNATRNCKTS